MHYCEELYQITIVIITVLNVFIHLEQKTKWIQSLVDNLNERFHNSKCRKCESCLENIKVQDKLLIFTCFKEDLVNFVNTYEICDWGINKLCFMLWKGVYLYEYMDSWERLNETKLPTKEEFCNTWHVDNITDTVYKNAI